MTITDIAKKYYTNLDNIDKKFINDNVADKGIEQYLNQQLVYLDCSRIINGMRMMQTIGYPYKKEICSYIYVLESLDVSAIDKELWINKLIELHNANIEYEKENPPIWYDNKSKKVNKRKPKIKEGDMFPEEIKKNKMNKVEAKLKAKLISNISFGNFKLKKD